MFSKSYAEPFRGADNVPVSSPRFCSYTLGQITRMSPPRGAAMARIGGDDDPAGTRDSDGEVTELAEILEDVLGCRKGSS